MAEREDGSSASSVLFVSRLVGEGVFVVLRWHGAIVKAVYAVVFAVPGTTVAEPDDDPVVTIGEDAGRVGASSGRSRRRLEAEATPCMVSLMRRSRSASLSIIKVDSMFSAIIPEYVLISTDDYWNVETYFFQALT